MRTSKLLSLPLLSFVVLAGCVAVSQVPQGYLNDTGSPAYSVTVPVENGYINVSNGNLHLEFPLASPPQRGAISVNERLVYDSRIWMFSPFGSHGSYHWWPYNVYGASTTSGGWRFVQGNEVGSLSFPYGTTQVISTGCSAPPYDGQHTTSTYSIVWNDPSGTLHNFDGTLVVDQDDCAPSYTQHVNGGYATDASGYVVQDDGNGNPVVLDNNGTQVYPQIIDRYGNYLSQDSSGNLIDDTGRVPVIITQNGDTTTYDVLAPNGPINNNGTRVRYTVVTAPVNVQTAFNESDVYEWVSPGLLNPVQSITLPDGSSYTFSYDSYGELSSVTLPTQGVITYGYTNFLDSSGTENRWLTSRTVGSNPPEYFVPSVITSCSNYSSGCIEQVSHRKPSHDAVVYQFTLNNGAWNTSTTVYTGTWNGSDVTFEPLVQTTNFNTYTNGCTDFYSCAGSNYISQSLTTTELFASGTPSVYSQMLSVFNEYPTKPSAIKHWDYMSVAGGVNTSQPPGTTPTSETDYAYTGLDIQSVSIYDSAHNLAGQTVYGYTSTPAQVVATAPQHGSQNAGGPYLQTITHWLNGGTSPVTTMGLDDTGQMVSVSDAKNSPTSTSYQCSNSLPLSVTNALNQTTTYSFDCSSGAITGAKEPNDSANNRAGTTYAYESTAGRLQSVSYPDGGSTTYSYPSSTEIDTTVAASPDPAISSADILDSYGRPYQHSQNGITSETSYDSNGRSYCVTNPHTASPSSTDGSTCITSYDGLDRPLIQQQADGNTVQWSYAANTTTTTDETGNQIQRTSDAFGRLTSVVETPSPGVSYTTNYTYDGLGNLYQANQLGRSGADTPEVRTFVHDTLGRLVSATVPEQSAAATYSYTSNGNFCSGDTSPCSETDARSVTTTFSYDALNRLTQKQAPGINYAYGYDSVGSGPNQNEIGRLVWASNNVNADEIFSYDAMGRLNWQSSWTPSSPNHTGIAMSAVYDQAGNMTDLTYPSGRHLKQSFDASGRLTSVNYLDFGGAPVNYNYVSNVSYSPPGGMATMSLGNGVTETAAYNNRLQLCDIQASLPTSVANPAITAYHKQYFFTASGNLCGNAPANNGNIIVIADALDVGRTQGFSYDNLNRLQYAARSDGAFNYNYLSDSFGNMQQSDNLHYTPPISFPNGSNRMQINGTGYGYDAAGNLTDSGQSLAGHQFAFDSVGQMMNVDSGSTATYTYDAAGNRVRKDLSNTWTEYVSFGGQTIAEKHADGSWTDYVFANGGRVGSAAAYAPVLHLSGVCGNCSGGASNYTVSSLAQWVSGYTIQTGDRLVFHQKQAGVAKAGLYIYATDGTNSMMNLFDTNGDTLNAFSDDSDTWQVRTVDLSGWAGKQISSSLGMSVEANTTPGVAWDSWISDVALVTQDGRAFPLFNGQQVVGTPWNGSAGSQFGVATDTDIQVVTHYYLQDHLGSARMEFAAGGWPLWAEDFAPFGQEFYPQYTPNHYKFTGQERDAETADGSGNGNDYFHARYYNAYMGRFTSPDPFDGSMDLANPQTLNRYSYVGNMPLNFTDPSGQFALCGASTAVYVAATGGLPGAVGGGIACGISIAAVVAKDIFDFIGLLPHHHLAGTTKKRPSVLGSPDFGVPYRGLNTEIGAALGLPGIGCEYGLCGVEIDNYGPGVAASAGPSIQPLIAQLAVLYFTACPAGNCKSRVYYGRAPVYGNYCATNHKVDGSSADPYSLWDCVGDLSACKANARSFQDACRAQGQVPLECSNGITVEQGQFYVCPCCYFGK